MNAFYHGFSVWQLLPVHEWLGDPALADPKRLSEKRRAATLGIRRFVLFGRESES